MKWSGEKNETMEQGGKEGERKMEGGTRIMGKRE